MNLQDLLPSKSEQGAWTGALSTNSEWHALAIGLGAGVVSAAVGSPELLIAVAMIALGEAQASGDQLRDVAREPAYAFAGMIVGYLAVGYGVNPQAIQRLVDLLRVVGGL